MKAKKKVCLADFREDPDNVSTATDEEIQRLAGKLKRVPLGLTAMRIAYVTDAPGGGCMVISGNKRLRCLKAAYGENGEVPAEWFQDITAMSEAERHEFRLNANISDGHFNLDKLLDQYGRDEITAAGLAELLEDIPETETPGKTDPDDVPDAPEAPRSRRGEVYQCGEHRLMCGDSTDPAAIDRLMDGVKADMVFTDPPYGVAYTGGMKIEDGKIKSNGKKQIKNDDLDYDNLYSFLYDVFVNIKINTVAKAPIYVFYAHSRSREFLNSFHDAGLKQRSIIIWHKTSGGFGDFMAQYMNAYEPCIYGSNGDSVNWYGATNEKTVWDMDKEKKCDLHPTMKPIELVARAVKNSSEVGNAVLDLFGGSGSTLIACEQIERTCYMMELDPHYCDVIRKRWSEFTHGVGCDWEKLTPKTKEV